MNVGVEITPLGNKLVVRWQGDLYCNWMKQKLVKSQTIDQGDKMALDIFGSKRNVKAFLKKNRVRKMVVSHEALGFDSCDTIV